MVHLFVEWMYFFFISIIVVTMEREKINSLNEKDFVTSLIISDKCCKILIPYINLNYFEVEYSRIVVDWVIGYYKQFKCCPKNDIRSLYLTHCNEIQDDALRDLVATFLHNLAESDININNEDYLLDRSKDFLDSLILKHYTEELNACLELNDVKKAKNIQAKYKKVAEVETNEVSLFSKDSVKTIQEALLKVDEELMTLPDKLNRVTGKLHRNDFMAILAPPKTGKSFFMQYLAVEAVKQGLNVVFVSMEMTREEVVQRMWKMLYGSKSGIIPEGIYKSAKIIEVEDNKYTSELVDIKVKANSGKSVTYLQKQSRAQNQYKGDIRIIAYPMYQASCEEITDRIEEIAINDNFVADVVIIDYADITKPMGGGSELRNQLDIIWKHLRGFAAKFHCLLVTASQTNRSAWKSSNVDGSSIGEDFRKIAQVTSFVSMEQSPKMKEECLMRIRNIAVRNDTVEETCVFPQCLSLGQFMIGNPVLGKDFIFNNGEENGEEE